MNVHGRLGHSFLDAVYREPLAIEFGARGVPCRRQVEAPISYRDNPLACGDRADSICYDEVIVELKALRQVTDLGRARATNDLKAAGLQRALLLHFGAPGLELHRLVREHTNLPNL
jgi:GxxExxY protein